MEPPETARGSAYVCFDTSPLIDYAKVGRLSDLAGWFTHGTCFTADVVTKLELTKGLRSHPENQQILDAPWLQSISVMDEDIQFVVDLRTLWGSRGDEDTGEAEVVALCKRYGWTAIMNDRRGRAAARRNGVACVSTAGLLVAGAAEGVLTADAAWALHHEVEGDYDHPMILPATDEYRAAFNRALEGARRWTRENQDVHWPGPLAMVLEFPRFGGHRWVRSRW